LREKKEKKWAGKNLERQQVEQLYSKAMAMLVLSHILEHFEMWDAKEHKDRWVIEMREKGGLIPEELYEKEGAVMDGYCNPLEMLSHSFVCKPIWLRLYRQRYKLSGEDRHYSNEYDLTMQGVRMVPELGIFLKE
jgi:hypothetical protein